MHWRRHPIAVLLALAATVVTLGVAAAMRPVGLTEVLLIVLVEVVGVSVLAGRAIAAATAVGAFLAVNWLLVPPYGTLHIADQAVWITLVVFLVLAVGASTLVESALGWEREAAAAGARAALLADALQPEAGSAIESLRVLRGGLDLDGAALVDRGTGRVLLSSGTPGEPAAASLVVDIPPDLQVQGWGPEVIGAQPSYVRSVATAVARSWQGEELVAEQQRSAQLAELDAARATLLASVGHDLRTPLAGIRVSADVLALNDQQLSAQDRAELLAGLRSSAIRLDAVIGAVLDSSRIEAGVAVVEPVATDLADIAARAAADLDSQRIKLDLPDAAPAVVDPVLLERIVANLLANSLAHTPGATPVLLAVRASRAGWEIRVRDQGPGLSGAAPDVGRARTGMGLVLVERLARMTGVGLTLTSSADGLLAVITVPGKSDGHDAALL